MARAARSLIDLPGRNNRKQRPCEPRPRRRQIELGQADPDALPFTPLAIVATHMFSVRRQPILSHIDIGRI